MKYTPSTTYSTIYLGAYPTTSGGGPKGSYYYLNIPKGVTIEPDQPTSAGGGAPGISAVGMFNPLDPHDGMLTNTAIVNFGTVIGGVGAPGTSSDNDGSGGDSGVATGNGATGGIGIQLAFNVTGQPPVNGYSAPTVIELTNEIGATITGGAGASGGVEAAGGTGGIGVSLTGYNSNVQSGSMLNRGTITGGAGGAGGQGVYAQGTGGAGGTGGVGLYLAHNGWLSDNGITGVIRGGDGGGAPAGAANEAGNTSGGGGIGVQLGDTTSQFSGLSNYGHIYGGNGVAAAFTQGGNGGVGVSIFTAANPGTPNPITGQLIQGELFNHNTIVGGNGVGTGTSGGAGLEIFGAEAVNAAGYYHSNGIGRYTAASITGGDGGKAGGVGVYLDRGTLYTSALISGGIGQNDGLADSVQFGKQHGKLVVDQGASFKGDIGGFVAGDTIDFANLTPTAVAHYFSNYRGITLATADDGTLTFSGDFTGEKFNFASDGGSGTDVYLTPGSNAPTGPPNATQAGTITTPVVLGTAAYPNSVYVLSDTTVAPTGYGSSAVQSDVTNANIYNHGTLQGAPGQQVGAQAGYSGGYGVSLTASGTILNFGSIHGGAGANAEPGGGPGGAGVSVQGSSGAAAPVYVNLYNYAQGIIQGGHGGTGLGGPGGGGDGVAFTGNTDTRLYNAGTIEGGDAAPNGIGGMGVYKAGFLVNGTTGVISGGSGNGGTGGIGLNAYYGTSTNITNDGRISGGSGGGVGSTGGVGVSMITPSLGTFTNNGIITGGSDGTGGVGLELNYGTVTNTGTIKGGAGGNGGAGVYETDGKLTNETGASIVGGAAGNSNYTAGVGVLLSGGTLATAGNIAGGAGNTPGDSVQFATKSYGPILEVESGATFTGAIGGFAIGDSIDLSNLSQSQVANYFGGSSASLVSGSYVFAGSASGKTLATASDGTLNLSGDFSAVDFVLTSDGGNGTDITLEAACYCLGTRILTERGEVAIETLEIGDRIQTLSDGLLPIRWIGRRSYDRRSIADDPDTRPIRIRAGALGPHLPERDLRVSPGHALYLDGMLIAARCLVNEHSIVREDSVNEVSYFHLEFAVHAVIFAEGSPAESFVDDESREMFDNAAEYHRLYPDALPTPARFCAPRVEEGRELERVRQRLAARAPWGASAA